MAEVSHPYTSPAKANEDALVYLRVENLSGQNLQLTALHTPISETSAIEIRLSANDWTTIGSMPIRPGELLDLETNGRIRLKKLTRAISNGESLSACLDFATGQKVPVSIAVGRIEY